MEEVPGPDIPSAPKPTVYHVIAPTQLSRGGGDSFTVLAGRPQFRAREVNDRK
jgi:hypothetical protein